ncbi:MAG: hypothetical protein K2L70_00750 [Clostridia bacterium]|nr:hypothetical protein [Clostridia bacterium]
MKQNKTNNQELQFNNLLNDIVDINVEPTASEDGVTPIDDRDKEYTKLIRAYGYFYSEKNKINIELRKKFFRYSFALLAMLILGMIVVAVVICFKVQNAVAIAAGIVSSIAALATSLLILPRIIGEYLFPKNEDEYIRDMICEMRNADEHRRDSEKGIPKQESKTSTEQVYKDKSK